MSRVVVLLTVLALSIQAGAVSNIVAFGDSLTDDCTHGAAALVDSVLDTDQVSVQPCSLEPQLLCCATALLR